MSAFPLKINPIVSEALAAATAVLALESTVLTHGLPYPQNFEAIQALEAIARAEGVVPATIALIRGKCVVGLDKEDKAFLERQLRSAHRHEIKKISIRELATAIVKGYTGGTTVSATMYIAHRAGIQVFATGGIGGVHRGWQASFDISSDLDALAKIPMVLVCAGSKAILDIPATLEVLESRSVPVLGWQCEEFPSFYSRTSGIKIPMVASSQELAAIFRMMHSEMQLPTALLLANPIPQDQEIPLFEIEPYILQAIAEAKIKGINGKELTPFLLDSLAHSTQGRSVEANLALLSNNVLVGAQIAKELL